MSEQTDPDALGSLFDSYTLGAAWDEMLAEPGSPRTAYKPVFHTLRAMNAGTLKERADTLARSYLDQGVTFDYAGEERPFPLDAVPRVISAHEWQVIDSDHPIGRDAILNLGVSGSKAEFLVLHDDDDTWAPDFLSRTVAWLDENPDQVAVAVPTVPVVAVPVAVAVSAKAARVGSGGAAVRAAARASARTVDTAAVPAVPEVRCRPAAWRGPSS